MRVAPDSNGPDAGIEEEPPQRAAPSHTEVTGAVRQPFFGRGEGASRGARPEPRAPIRGARRRAGPAERVGELVPPVPCGAPAAHLRRGRDSDLRAQLQGQARRRRTVTRTKRQSLHQDRSRPRRRSRSEVRHLRRAGDVRHRPQRAHRAPAHRTHLGQGVGTHVPALAPAVAEGARVTGTRSRYLARSQAACS